MKKSILFSMLFLFVAFLNGQVLQVPWICTFESATENANWQLNTGPLGPLCNDKWYISNATANDGNNSLYISNDGGVNYKYGANPNVVVAYRDILLAAGDYEISFDWKGMPRVNAGGLHVYWELKEAQEDPDETLLSNNTTHFINPNFLTPKLKRTVIQRNWKNESFRTGVMPANTPMRLIFVWQNNNTDTLQPDPYAVCIDNIQIYKTNCKKPSELKIDATCDTLKVSWKGTSTKYQVQHRKKNDKFWSTAVVTPSTSSLIKQYVISGIEEGVYDVRVRGICTNDTSGWNTVSNTLSFCPSNHCLNYTNLYGSDVSCWSGLPSNPGSFVKRTPIDHGADDTRSRHTVCWEPNRDVRTKNKLVMIPDGEFASVRIGNLELGGTADRVEFDYHVDPDQSILLLNYAIVLQEPGHPNIIDQPGFFLEVFEKIVNPFDPDDIQLKPIDPVCGKAKYYAQDNANGWQTEIIPGLKHGTKVVWKDWTTVGLDLGAQAGKNVVIQVTVQGCAFEAHFGYAYFTLGCTKREILGVSCGDVPTMTISAPEGFKYIWTADSETGAFVSDQKEITVPSDDETVYYCKVISKDNDDCYFYLNTNVKPRIPKADFSFEVVRENCVSKYKFKNKSHVQTKVDGVIVSPPKVEPCQHIEWDFGNGISSQEEILIEIPKKGGQLKVKLKASISQGACVDSMEMLIEVPELLDYKNTIDTTVCYSHSIISATGKYYGTTGVYYDTVPTIYGCDSVLILDLKVHSYIADITTYDTICFGQVLTVGGKNFSTTGKHRIVHKTKYGCDSIEYLNLYVYPEVLFDYEKTDIEDTPKSGAITISNAPDNYTYSINGVSNGALTGLDAGIYTVIVYDAGNCPSKPVEIIIKQDCLDISFGYEKPIVCSGDENIEVPIIINEGVTSTYSLKYDSKAIAAGFVNVVDEILGESITIKLPEQCKPNVYTVNFVANDILCEKVVLPLEFTVLYPHSIMVQKWNDVIALLSKNYNGGYEFSQYQWYRNGNPMPNETKPILYLDGTKFELNDNYHVELTRVDDGVKLPSCPMTPTDKPEDPKLYPTKTVAETSQKLGLLNVYQDCTVRWYDALGRLYSEAFVTVDNPEIITPTTTGFYILEIKTEKSCTVTKMYIK